MARRTLFRQVEVLEDRSTPAVAYALQSDTLVAFDTSNPAAALAPVTVGGLAASDDLVGIDFRPQTGMLYGLARDNTGNNTVQLYSISVRTGFATAVGGRIENVTGTDFGFDFNPVVDRIRVVTNTGLNFRINPNTGALVPGAGPNMLDPSINGVVGNLDASAYTNNAPNVQVTTLYGLNAAADALVVQSNEAGTDNPNLGTTSRLHTVTLNGAPLNFTAANGFDIPTGVNVTANNMSVTSGTGFAALTVGGVTRMYAIDLTNGQATDLGTIGTGGGAVQGLAVSNDLGTGVLPGIALSSDGTQILRSTGGAVTTATISGVAVGQQLVGLDIRPQTGQFYALGVPTAPGSNTGTLYLIDPQTTFTTATATVVGQVILTTGTLPLPSVGYGFDFNPTVDRIRVVTGNGLNFRINPNNGLLAAQDTNINSAPGGPTGADATAYTNSFGQPLTTPPGPTTQYTLDAAAKTLSIQNPPNMGTQTQVKTVTLNGATLDFTAVNGFDIPPSVSVAAGSAVAAGQGIALLTVGGTTSAYAIDLTTGAATLIQASPAVAGFTVGDGPAGAVGFGFPPGAATRFQAGTTATITVTRTGGSLGAVTAALAQSGGTAVAGTDFTGLPTSVSFASGQTTATVTFTVPASAAGSGARTLVLGLSNPTNGAVLGSMFTPILTIAQPLVVAPPTLPPGAIGVAYAQTLTATGTPGPITFGVTAGSLPPGLTLNPTSGAITGTPTATGPFAFTVTATDTAAQATGTRQYTLSVFPAPRLAPTSLPSGSVGTAYSQAVTATAGASPGPFTFAVTAGTLPAGLTLNANTGVISGIPTAIGTSNFTLTARDASTAATGSQQYSIVVSAVPVTITLSPAALPGGVVGTAFSQAITATGGTAPVAFTVSNGTLPAGLTLTASGLLSGTPAAAGTSNFTVTATDALGNTGAQQYTLTVVGAPVPPPVLPSQYAVGQDVGGGVVNVYNAAGGLVASFSPFGTGYTAGVRPAVADVTGDGIADLIVASGPGVPVGIVVYDGATNQVLATLNPFEPGFLGGAYVAAGDINRDGVAEIVVTPDQSGGPRVVVFSRASATTFTQTASFFGIDDPNFRGGVRAAVSDVNGDGFGDIIVAAGFGGGPRVAVFNGTTIGGSVPPTRLFNDFFAFDPSLRDGIYVAGGDYNADGFGDIVTGGGPGGGPRVQTLSGRVAVTTGSVDAINPPAGLVLSNFFAGDPNNRGGIRVASKNLNTDANADLVVGSGQGAGSRVTTYFGNNLVAGNTGANTSFDAFAGFTGGVFVG